MSDVNWKKMKVADLREELQTRGLDTKGTKPQLIKRLEKAAAGGDGLDTTTGSSVADTDLDDTMETSTTEPEEAPPVVTLIDDDDEPEMATEATEEPEIIEDEPEIIEDEPEVQEEPEPEPEVQEEEASPSPQQSEEVEEPVAAPVEEEAAPEEAEAAPEKAEEAQPEAAEEKEPEAAPEEQQKSVENGAEDAMEDEQQGEFQVVDDSEAPADGEQKDEAAKKRSHSRSPSRRHRSRRSRSRSRSPVRRRSRSGSHGSRSRHRSGSRERHQRRRSRSPPARIPEPEESEDWLTATNVQMDRFNCDLNLRIDESGLKANPITVEGFAFMWAGARSNYGVDKGKVGFEVKILDKLNVDHLPAEESSRHVVRVGFSTDTTTTQLGEEKFSYGYGGTGKASTDCKFNDFGEKFDQGDVIGAFVDFDAEPITISYTKNGEDLGTCFEIEKESLGEQALLPHVLTKNCEFEFNFGEKEEPYFAPKEGFTYLNDVPVEDRVRGTPPPAKKEDCQIILMCGLPGAGKTVWAAKHSAENKDMHFNVLGTNNIIEKMKVMGLPRKRNYAGRWDVLIDKSTKCLNRLFEIASKKKRNYILDQTNVYQSARRRKMRPFEGFQRKAIVIVPSDEEFKSRTEKREKEEGKDVPDQAVLEMKANFSLPEQGILFDEIEFIELDKEEAAKLIETYNKDAQAALPPPEKRYRNDRGDRPTRWGGRGGGRDMARGGGGGRDFGGRGGGRFDNRDNNRGGRWGGSGGGGGRYDDKRGGDRDRDRNSRDNRTQRYSGSGGGNRYDNRQSGGSSWGNKGQGSWGGSGGGNQQSWGNQSQQGWGNQGWGNQAQNQAAWGQQGYNQQAYNQAWAGYNQNQQAAAGTTWGQGYGNYGNWNQGQWSGYGQQPAATGTAAAATTAATTQPAATGQWSGYNYNYTQPK